MRFLLAVPFLLAFVFASIVGPVAAQPQYVIISFDGALHNEQWERSRALATRTGASFTYFLSCVYLLTRETRGEYKPPDRHAGASNVGFGFSREDVALRLAHIWAARDEGHDIASHGCGHFDGGDWTEAEWSAEFDQFQHVLEESWEINAIPGKPEGWTEFARSGIVGFRAPYLSTGDGLYAALAEHGFAYDASAVSQGPQRPDTSGRVTHFALPMVAEGPKERPVIAMDYNLFVRHSGGVEQEDDGSFEDRTVAAFTAALDEQIAGERIPLQIGYHFTLMNGGAYWRALERFALDACARPQVRCVSYRDYLEATGRQRSGPTAG